MPTTREEIEVLGHKIDHEIEFQVWCYICGAGICGNVRYQRGSVNHFTCYCGVCEKEKNDLEGLCRDIKREVEELRRELRELNEQKEYAR
jgi:hypothetical protein